MNYFCPTIVVRHNKERLKKCSLNGLEKRPDIHFFSYPLKTKPILDNYIYLSSESQEILSWEDRERGLLLLDGTWRLAKKMENNIALPPSIIRRSLPKEIQTGYPRCQNEPGGLASVEALYVAYLITGRDPTGLLDQYYWKGIFLEKNPQLICSKSF